MDWSRRSLITCTHSAPPLASKYSSLTAIENVMPGVVGSRVAVQCGLHSLAIHERAPVSHLNEHVAVFAMPDVSHYPIAFEGQSRLRRICPTDVYFWGEGIHGGQ